jgi:hypothetical protein
MFEGKIYSQELKDSLKSTAARMMAKLNEVYTDEFALEKRVSDAYTVVVPEEIQEKFKVSRYGRKQLQENEVILHVAPKVAHYPMDFVSQDSTMIDTVLTWARKGYAEFNQDPVREMLMQSAPKAHWYERELFKTIRGEIVLVNPSTSTLWNTKDMDVYVSADEGARPSINREYDRMQKIPRYVKEGERSAAVHYYGIHQSNPRVNVPFPWYRFQPSPQQVAMYQDWKVARDAKGCHVSYNTKTFHAYRIENEVGWVRLSPVTTDAYLGTTGQKYMLETNVQLPVSSRDTKTYEGAGYFSGPLPSPSVTGHIEDATHVWDVPGVGTVLSRRGRARKYAADTGKQLKDIEQGGTVPIGMFTEVLRETTIHYSGRGMQTISVIESEELPPEGSPEGIEVSRNPEGEPLLSLPGLYYRKVRYSPQLRKVYTKETRYFFARTMGEVMQRLPLVLKHFSPGSNLPLTGKGPSVDWIALHAALREAGTKEQTLGDVVRENAVTEYTVRMAMRGSTELALAHPKKLYWWKYRHRENRQWGHAPDAKPMNYVIVLIQKYLPGVHEAGMEDTIENRQRFKLLNQVPKIKGDRLFL